MKYKSTEWTIQKIIDSVDLIEWDIFCEHFKPKTENIKSYGICLYYFDFFYLFKERINWNSFCKNKNVQWNQLSRTLYSHQITDKYRQNYRPTTNVLIEKANINALQLPLKFNLFSMYFNKWDWNEMSGNEFVPEKIWTSIFRYQEYKDAITKLNFKKLSSLKNIPWNLSFHSSEEKKSILDFSDQWDWTEIVTNKNIKWNNQMIIDHAKYFPWEGQSGGRIGHYWYKHSVVAKCGHINFPIEVLKQYTNNWAKGMYDGCIRADSEGDWIVFSKNHKINIYILKEFSSKLDLKIVIENKINWTIEELILMKNIILENYLKGDEIFDILVKNEKVKELILIEKLKEL